MIFLPSPTVSCYFLLFPAISCMSCCFLQFPVTAASCYVLLCLVISYDFLLFPASFEHFLLCHARSCYFMLFLPISCNFLRLLSQRDCDLHWFASCKSAANHCKSHDLQGSIFNVFQAFDLHWFAACKSLQIRACRPSKNIVKHMQISANHCKSRLRKIIEKTTLICSRWRVRYF